MPSFSSVPRPRSGFTLVELLVVIGIIGALFGLFLPAVQKVRVAANRIKCANNLRQITLALHHFEFNNGGFPPAAVRAASPFASWVPFILPYIEQQYVPYDLKKDWMNAANINGDRTALELFMCPAVAPNRFDSFSYPAIMGACGDYTATRGLNQEYLNANPDLRQPADLSGCMYYDKLTRITEITDGTSNSFLVAEDAGRPELWHNGKQVDGGSANGAWADPDYEIALDGSACDGTGITGSCVINCTNDNEVYSFHTGGANISFADGSVHFIRESIAKRVFTALYTKAGAELIVEADY